MRRAQGAKSAGSKERKEQRAQGAAERREQQSAGSKEPWQARKERAELLGAERALCVATAGRWLAEGLSHCAVTSALLVLHGIVLADRRQRCVGNRRWRGDGRSDGACGECAPQHHASRWRGGGRRGGRRGKPGRWCRGKRRRRQWEMWKCCLAHEWRRLVATAAAITSAAATPAAITVAIASEQSFLEIPCGEHIGEGQAEPQLPMQGRS